MNKQCCTSQQPVKIYLTSQFTGCWLTQQNRCNNVVTIRKTSFWNLYHCLESICSKLNLYIFKIYERFQKIGYIPTTKIHCSNSSCMKSFQQNFQQGLRKHFNMVFDMETFSTLWKMYVLWTLWIQDIYNN